MGSAGVGGGVECEVLVRRGVGNAAHNGASLPGCGCYSATTTTTSPSRLRPPCTARHPCGLNAVRSRPARLQRMRAVIGDARRATLALVASGCAPSHATDSAPGGGTRGARQRDLLLELDVRAVLDVVVGGVLHGCAVWLVWRGARMWRWEEGEEEEPQTGADPDFGVSAPTSNPTSELPLHTPTYLPVPHSSRRVPVDPRDDARI
jgi:hypothetical protein